MEQERVYLVKDSKNLEAVVAKKCFNCGAGSHKRVDCPNNDGIEIIGVKKSCGCNHPVAQLNVGGAEILVPIRQDDGSKWRFLVKLENLSQDKFEVNPRNELIQTKNVSTK